MDTRYISLEDAFQAIEGIDENAGARGSGFTDPERIMRDSAFYALDAIQPADVVPGPRWIPVKERLPEEFQKVLVFWREHSEPMIDTAFWQKEAKRFDGEHWVRMEDKVTHWMPLPEPPK